MAAREKITEELSPERFLLGDSFSCNQKVFSEESRLFFVSRGLQKINIGLKALKEAAF